jgi:XRE family aerobic/anaerobic benzoate catabolism transcriptional regulator
LEKSRENVLGCLAKRVRAQREERGLTRQQLSDRAGVSPRFLAQLEAGDGNISVARLCEVARALGTTASALLEGVGVSESHARLVALVGLRGAGKSTVGPRLAERMGIDFIELDRRVEAEAGLSLGEVFELHGEDFYKRLERRVLQDLVASGVSAVVATGGSIVSDRDSFELLRESAVTVWLKAKPEDHMARVVAQGDERPMRSRADAMTELRAILKARTPLYARADHVVDTSLLGVDGAVDLLATTLSVS